jgi:predicted nucleic acid-binding protein
LAVEGTGTLAASELMRVEAAYALEQKERRGEVRTGGASALLVILDHDIEQGRFTLFPVGSDVLREAVSIARICYRSFPAVSLRTLDGVHLATTRILKCRHMATADERMLAAAQALGIDVLRPGGRMGSHGDT